MKADTDFRIADTAIAAWLISQGVELYGLDSSDPQNVYFVFPADGNITKLVNQFELGVAVGNVGVFYRAYRHLLTRIREAK